MKIIGAIGLCLVGACASGPAQPLPGGESILRRVDDSLRVLGDYTVDLDITADLEGISIPPARVRMSFKYPDRTRFESEGFALVPREALDLTPGRILDHFTVVDVARDTLGNDRAYRLLLRGVPQRTRFPVAEIVVHAGRWTIDRLSASMSGGRRIDARFVNAPVEGHWLPHRLTIVFSDPSTGQPETPPSPLQKPDAGLQVRTTGGGTVSVLYGTYRLHAGLPDSLFTPSPRP